MGEAKRRKAVDPTYGRSKRGLVVSPPIELSGVSMKFESISLDQQELRSNLLFWDTLDFPSNNLIHIPLGPDEEFLEQEGILKRTHIEMTGSFSGIEPYLRPHLEAYRRLDAKNPGKWSLATGPRSIRFPPSELNVNRGALVRLYGLIPVPDAEVPLVDLLEFRQKRRSELLTLREHLEQIYQRIVSAGDGELALESELNALERAITDHLRASRETRFKWRLADFNASLNLVPGVAAAAASYSMGLPIGSAVLTGILSSGLSLGPSFSLKNGRPSGTPFQYVTSYHSELFHAP